jgi:hypothetical protein
VFDWTQDAVNTEYTDYTSAVEPVLTSCCKNGRHLLHSVMHVTGYMGEGRGIPMSFPLDRPTAIDACGTQLFALSKYGHIKIVSLS